MQQKIEKRINERFPPQAQVRPKAPPPHTTREARHIPDEEVSFGEAEKYSRR